MAKKQVIVIRKDLKMRRGKEIAQGAHASLKSLLDTATITDDAVVIPLTEHNREWLNTNFKKVTVVVNSEEELVEVYEQAKAAGIPSALIVDSGLTEFNGVPTKTTCAIGPAEEELINPITGHLKLY